MLRAENIPLNCKTILTPTDVKKHLHDIREQRRLLLTKNIDECHRLQIIHKKLFHHQLYCDSTDKYSYNRTLSNECLLTKSKYSIPRIQYAPIIYRTATPKFKIDQSVSQQNDIPIVKELKKYLTESLSYATSSDKISANNLQTKSQSHQRCSSVSPVSSDDKRAHRVYEIWPDYNQISQIVGYRIDPPTVKLNTSNNSVNQSKQVKQMANSNCSSSQKQLSKRKKSKQVKFNEKPIEQPQIQTIELKPIEPKLPTILCPSSMIYSKQIQTRQWLVKHDFSLNSNRIQPLI